MKSKRNRLNSEWEPRDVSKLRACARRRMSQRQAAGELGRTRGAVAFKAMKLGIHFSSINQPRNAQRKANRTKRARAIKAQPIVRATRSA